MSHTNKMTQKNTDFMLIYNRSYRLAAAVFMISNVMSRDEELKTKVKRLSLEIVSMSVNLKDIDFLDAKKLITDIEKNSLELMSMLDIACFAGLVSKMNGDVIKEEFRSFLSGLELFLEKFEGSKNVSVKSVFSQPVVLNAGDDLEKAINVSKNIEANNVYENKNVDEKENNKRQKRKDLRKNTILDFIKGHSNISIKDIAPNIIGCSEKTIQRELTLLINNGKIKKSGERRWSRYSAVQNE